MLDFLSSPFASTVQIQPLDVAVRLLTALLMGAIISLVYRRTRRSADIDRSFPVTLMLLCVLIAMVTQVIGDNVARAFGLVGALSIVRFRTVVRDTQDTAYVIFAVIVGMAVGAKSLWVAVLGIAVVVLAEVSVTLHAGRTPAPPTEYLLKVRAERDCDLDTLVRSALGNRVIRLALVSFGTGKQGASFEGSYAICPRPEVRLPDLVKEIDTTAGVQHVEIVRRGDD